MKEHGTIVACGAISSYDAKKEDTYGNKNLFHIITKRLKMQGFIITDSMSKFPEGT